MVRNIERLVRTGLVAAIALGVACTEAKPNSTPLVQPTPPTAPKPDFSPTPTAIPTVAGPLSEKRENGEILEKLEFSRVNSRAIINGINLQIGKYLFRNDARGYEVMLDPQQFLQIAQQCGVDKLPHSINIDIDNQFTVGAGDKQSPLDLSTYVIPSGPNRMSLLLGMDTFYRVSQEELQDYEIDPLKSRVALDNLATLNVNLLVLNGLCTMPKTIGAVSGNFLEKTLDESKPALNAYEQQLMSGQRPPIFIVRRTPVIQPTN